MFKTKKRVGFDINNTIDNYIQVLLEVYNKRYNDNLLYENITDYNVVKFIKSECSDFWKEFSNDENLSKLKLQDGVKDVINYCYENFELRFITAIFPINNNCDFFYNFLKNNFDWMETKHFVRLEDKQEYNVDLLIDDYLANLIGGNYAKIIRICPWNKNISTRRNKMFRIDQWDKDSINIINHALGIDL